MRILIVTPYLPWPLNHGGSAAQFSTLRCLARDHQFTLLVQIYNEAEKANLPELASRLPEVRIRGVFCGRPATQDSLIVKALKRVIGLARKWLRPTAKVRPAEPPKFPWYPFSPLPQALIEALHEELAKGCDLVQCEFAQTMPLGVALPPDVPKLFVHHQLASVSSERQLDVSGATAYGEYIAAVTAVQEIAYLRHFDAVITFSETDRDALAEHLDIRRVHTSPFPVPDDITTEEQIPKGFEGQFLFIGSELHEANRDALLWLIDHIWPQITGKLPNARLLIVGSWSERWQSRVQVEGVSFAGFVDDLSNVMRGGMMLVPVRVGSGIRAKILLAFAHGVPVITTSIGCEGLLARDSEELMVCDDAFDFAETAVTVARDSQLWRRLAVAGLEVAAQHYSPEAVRQRRNEIYSAVVKSRFKTERRKFA